MRFSIPETPAKTNDLPSRIFASLLEGASEDFMIAWACGCDMESESRHEGEKYVITMRTRHPVAVMRDANGVPIGVAVNKAVLT